MQRHRRLRGRAWAEGEGKMTDRIHIRQGYRHEFEQLGEIDLRKRLEAGLFDKDKRKHGWAWPDEKANGEERRIGLDNSSCRRKTIAGEISRSPLPF